MRYAITSRVLSRENSVVINKARFDDAKIAKRCLSIALGIEEKINIVLENYAEYEEELLGITVRRMLFNQFEHSSFMDDINLINRRLTNLFTACRLYIDHLKHDLSSLCGGDSPQATAINNKMAEEYDACLGYRAIEAMRNYAQHRGLPISTISHWSCGTTDTLGRQRMRNTTTPLIDTSVIDEDGGFKRSVLDELIGLGTEVDITLLVRDYITSIGDIHILVRHCLDDQLNQWDSIIRGMIEAYRTTGDVSLSGLAAVELDDQDRDNDVVYLSDEVINRRAALSQKNSHLSHFGYSFVSGEIVPEQD